jgi:septin family protein
MKKTLVTKSEFNCEFCGRDFLRESTMAKHLCENKQRWMNKDLQGNRIGFQAWIQFYKKNTSSKKNKTYEEFIRSAYYSAFVKFGNYCADVNVINVSRYADWLLKNQISIDTWTKDTN